MTQGGRTGAAATQPAATDGEEPTKEGS